MTVGGTEHARGHILPVSRVYLVPRPTHADVQVWSFNRLQEALLCVHFSVLEASWGGGGYVTASILTELPLSDEQVR